MTVRRFLAALLMLFALGILTQVSIGTTPAGAQNVSEEQLKPLVDLAKEKGLEIIVVGPADEENETEVDTGPSVGENALKVRSELRRIFGKVLELPSAIVRTIQRVSPDGTYNWLLIAVGTAILGIVVGTVPSIFTRNFFRSFFEHLFNPEPKNRAEKISYLLFRAFMILVNLTMAICIGIVVAVILDSGHDASRATIGVIFVTYSVYRIFRHVIFFNMLAPDLSSHRVFNLGDEAAEKMQKHWRNTILVVAMISGFFVWLALIGLPPDPLKLLVIVSLAVSAIILGAVSLAHRKNFAQMILGAGDASTKPIWHRILANQWHLLLIAYLVIAWVVSSARIVLDLPSALPLIVAPAAALIVGLALYGLIIVIIDRVYQARQRRFEERVERDRAEREKQREAEETARQEALASRSEDDADDEMIINTVMHKDDYEEMPVFQPVFKPLLEQAAGLMVLIVGIGYVLGTWDVNIGDKGNPVTAFMDTLGIIFAAWFFYRAVIVYIDTQIENEGDAAEAEDGEPGEEMSGKSASRLATLLPLLRNVLIVTILVLAVMIVLSNMGVDIAPLFAGAGVIGLAVGFGAQTMIRDIFSGGFFLFDDAFRKGEYIELGDIRGTVEKISLRSFQLRHHNGPLHTIPFGEITQLTNYSRDWVMMKLPLRVTYDTDVERVRKLVKKLGQQLLEHPEVGHRFLQPLKSQGVYKMEDSAMIIRVKFMTKPGDQFVTRKVVYAAIRDLFEREGIRFANKEVTVRLAEEQERPLTDAEKQSVAASAGRAIADEEALAAAGKPADDDRP